MLDKFGNHERGDPLESNLISRMSLAMAPAAVTEEYVEMGEGA